MIGGNGPKRTLPLVAKYANEWNAVYIPANKFAELSGQLDELLEENGRLPATVRRSMMTNCLFGQTSDEVNKKLDARNATFEQVRNIGILVGTANQIIDQLGELATAGVQRVMLQWLDLNDLDGLKAMATSILPQL